MLLGDKADSDKVHAQTKRYTFVPCNLYAFFRTISAAEPWGCTCINGSAWGEISSSLHQFVQFEVVTWEFI